MTHSTTLSAHAPADTFKLTEGIDLGDRTCATCLIDPAGRILDRGTVKTDREQLLAHFGQGQPRRVVIEASTHAPWIGRLIRACGHELIVASPRHVRSIADNPRKNDPKDAEQLARLGRADPKLLAPVALRTQQQQQDLQRIRQRDSLIRARTALINTQRGLAKSSGVRLPVCSAEGFARRMAATPIDAGLREVLAPGFAAIAELSRQIEVCDRQLATAAKERYPVTQRLQQAPGVGPVVAITFVLTVGDPERFQRSRDLPPWVGLVPGQRQSGGADPQRAITKCGNTYLRCLLVTAAQRILQERTPDCDLKRHGLRVYQSHGETKIAKRIAVIAVARKLAVVLHRLWVGGEAYRPLRAQSDGPATPPAASTATTGRGKRIASR